MRVALLAIALPACSFAFARVPTPRADGTVDCRDTTAMTAIDTAIAALIVVGGLAFVESIGSGKDNEPPPFRTQLGMVLVPAAPFIVSALFGVNRRIACRDVAARLEREARERDTQRAAESDTQHLELRARQDAKAAAWKLAKKAEIAAANGDCATAIAFGEQIRVLDELTFRGEYAQNAGIAACRPSAPEGR